MFSKICLLNLFGKFTTFQWQISSLIRNSCSCWKGSVNSETEISSKFLIFVFPFHHHSFFCILTTHLSFHPLQFYCSHVCTFLSISIYYFNDFISLLLFYNIWLTLFEDHWTAFRLLKVRTSYTSTALESFHFLRGATYSLSLFTLFSLSQEPDS